jgi:hypothetical protein
LDVIGPLENGGIVGEGGLEKDGRRRGDSGDLRLETGKKHPENGKEDPQADGPAG